MLEDLLRRRGEDVVLLFLDEDDNVWVRVGLFSQVFEDVFVVGFEVSRVDVDGSVASPVGERRRGDGQKMGERGKEEEMG